jgi:putative phage-type endonuclease
MSFKKSYRSNTIRLPNERGKLNLYTPETINGAKLLGTFESGSDEWHELRSRGIGGSEIGTILGLNPWESAYYLWATKTGQLPPKQLDSFAVKLGNWLEPMILDTILPEVHPDWKIYRTGTYQHPRLSFLHANPDALAMIDGELCVVEVKTSRNYWSEVPPHYVAQLQHYMNVLGIKRGFIVGLVGMDWVEHEFAFDQFEADVMEQRAIEFWDSVRNGHAPDFDGSESTYEAVRELHPDIEPGLEIEIDGIHNLANAQLAFEEAEFALRKQKSEVLALMGKAQHAYTEVDGVRYRVASRQSRAGSKPFLVINKRGNK